MTPDSLIKLTYYAFSMLVGISTVVGSYFASRAGITTTLKNIMERQDRTDRNVETISESITVLARDIGYLEGRVNGKAH